MIKNMSINPKFKASERSPFEVSSVIAVVITLVTPSMFPPTIKTAPTSERARPKPASRTVIKENLASHRSVKVA